jgi:hypothetical protein
MIILKIIVCVIIVFALILFGAWAGYCADEWRDKK